MRGESWSDREEINTQQNLEGKEERDKKRRKVSVKQSYWKRPNWSKFHLIECGVDQNQTNLINMADVPHLISLVWANPKNPSKLIYHAPSINSIGSGFFGLVDQLKIRWVCPPMRLPRETQCLWLKRKGRFFHFLVFRALCAFEKKMSWMAQTKGSSHHLVTSEACQLFKIVFYSDNADGNISVE